MNNRLYKQQLFVKNYFALFSARIGGEMDIGKDSPATIKLRFVTEDDLISALIREKTWCDYSHVEFVLDDGTTLGARSSGGVQIRPANYANFSKIQQFAVDCTVEQKFQIESFAQSQLGKAYDTGAIAGLMAHRDWRDPDKWFCSELVAAAFEQAVPLLRIPDSVDRVTPRDLLLSVKLRSNI
jgi:hypothetical protein